MSEIEKMYENAEIKPKYSGWLDMGDLDTQMEYIQCDTKEEWDECVFMSRSSYSSDDKNYDKPKMDYPPFTAEKQIELIKNICPAYPLNYHIKCFQGYSFEEGLAKCINNLWQYLTEEEKQQVKGILE